MLSVPSSNLTICSANVNVSCWYAEVKRLNQVTANILAPVIIIMFIFLFVGFFGNTFVVMMYRKRRQKTTAHVFIMFLAIIDWAACAIIHPYVIYKLFNSHDQTWVTTCKFFEVFIHFNLALSGLALLLIAIDRYLAICHPVKFLMFDKHVIKGITTITVIAFVFSLPLFEFYGAAPYEIKVNYVHLITYRCHYRVEYQTSLVLTVFGAFIFLCFLVEVVTMIILYKRVAVTAYKSKRTVKPFSNAHILAGLEPIKIAQSGEQASKSGLSVYEPNPKSPARVYSKCNNLQAEARPSKSHLFVISNTRNTFVTHNLQPQNNDDFKHLKRLQKSVNDAEAASKNHKDSKSSAFGNKSFKSRLKAAKILFCVTAVFFVSWLPFLFVRLATTINEDFWNDNAETTMVIRCFFDHLFYLNNAINPIIYTLINRKFRQECKTVFQRICMII